MDFSNYQKYNSEYEKKYNRLFALYPYAMMVLDESLRRHHRGLKIKAINDIKKIIKYSIAKHLIVFISYIKIFLLRYDKRNKVYLHIPRFNHLSRYLKRKGYIIINRNNNKKDMLSLNNVSLREIILYNKINRIINQLVETGFDRFISSEEHMNQLNKIVKSELEKTINIIKKLKITTIISEGESPPQHRIMLEAAKSLGVRYVVIAHGYVTNSYLDTICPIRSDYLFVWTRQQKDIVSKYITEREKIKIRYEGYPKIISNINNYNSKKIVLLILSLVESDEKKKKTINNIKKLLLRIDKDYESTIIRLHPLQWKDEGFIKDLKKTGAVVSFDNSITDLKKAKIVLGMPSSLLFEAYCNNKIAYQIKEMIYGNEIPEIPIIKIDDIDNIKINKKREKQKSLKKEIIKYIV